MQTVIDISLFLFGAIVATLIIFMWRPRRRDRSNPILTVGELKARLNRYPDAMGIQIDAVDEPVYCPAMVLTVEERCDEIERLYISIEPEEQ